MLWSKIVYTILTSYHVNVSDAERALVERLASMRATYNDYSVLPNGNSFCACCLCRIWRITSYELVARMICKLLLFLAVNCFVSILQIQKVTIRKIIQIQLQIK